MYEKMKVICIDIGHGGSDSGAIGVNGLKEKDYNLLICEKVINYLKNYDVKVVSTRESDEFISLEKRVNISNKNKCDLFISIHCNAHINNEANGFETYSYSGNTDLQKLIHKNILNRIPSLKDRGIKKASYYVLKYTKAKAVLIECGFITNKSDYEILLDNVDNFALSICQSIVTFLGLKQIDNREVYRVCVGSYTIKENAQNMLKQLQKDGYKPFITKATI